MELGEKVVLPEAQLFLNTRGLEFIELLNKVLDSGRYITDMEFASKQLNAMTEWELAVAIRKLKFIMRDGAA